MINNNTGRVFSTATKVVEFDCKELPIKLSIESFVSNTGEERVLERFYVEVTVDDTLERIELLSEKGLKKRKLVEYITKGEIYNLKVRQKEFKKNRSTIKYAAFYTPIIIDGYKTDMRFSIDVGKDGDNRTERYFLLKALGLTFDSIDGLSDYDENVD